MAWQNLRLPIAAQLCLDAGVKLQRHFIKCDNRILILLEGRDASGKDGVIKRIVEHLSPRDTRVVALGKPSDRERDSWYFQRFVPPLPATQELVLFNRSCTTALAWSA